MGIPVPDQVRANGRKFELLLGRLLLRYDADGAFSREVQALLEYLKGMGMQNGLIKTILGQLQYHRFEKFFLGLNAYGIAAPGRPGISDRRSLAEVMMLGETISIPIIFMDDIVDSHEMRNGKPTPYGHLLRKYPARGKEFTLFHSNVMVNYLVQQLMSKGMSQPVKDDILRHYVLCANKTYLSQVTEHDTMPRTVDDMLAIYREKSYYFTTYFMSGLGCLLGAGTIKDDALMQDILLNLTYLLSLKNDLSDIAGKKRRPMQDLFHRSNTLGMYLLRRSLGSPRLVRSTLARKERGAVTEMMKSAGSVKEVLSLSIRIRDSVRKSVADHGGEKRAWFLNYGLYSDFILKDLLDNLNYVR